MNAPKTLYAIKDITNNKIIWNSHGGAYHDERGVTSRLKRLTKDNPNNKYCVICWDLRSWDLKRGRDIL